MTVPLFGHQVPVVQDEAVDPAFGSGAVMICTFGDKQDVHWWKQHNLALRKAIDRQGKMSEIAGKYKGMNTTECRKAILSDMKTANILHKQEKPSSVSGRRAVKHPSKSSPNGNGLSKSARTKSSSCTSDQMVSGTYVPADGKLDHADGMGLVYLPSTGVCHTDTGLVL